MELRQYLDMARRWWWLVILLTVVAGVTSYAVSQRQVPVYEATATLMVGQSIQATELTTADILTSERLARTYADIARRQPVLQGVVETLSLSDTWQALKERVEVRPVRDTQLLEIVVEAGSPVEARVIADEIARQLILLSPTALENREKDENQRLVRQRLEVLQGKIDAGQGRVQELEVAMNSSLSAQQVQELQAEINTLEGLIVGWENTHTQLLIFIESERSPNYLVVIEPAQGKSEPIRPRILVNTALAGVVGFLLALGLIFLLEYLDDTLKSAGDVNQFLGVASLGTVGHIKGKRYHEKLVPVEDPFSPASEAYRIIRSNIQFMSIDRPIKSILVTSPIPGEGKSITAANLAVVMGQDGLKTILVDADLRRPVQHVMFRVAGLKGLTDLLRSPDLEINSHLKPTQFENLQVITYGDLPPNPAEVLGSQRMKTLLARLSEMADVVILDSPPAVTVTDAAILANRVDGTLLVIEAGQSRRDPSRQAVTNLQQAGANLLGCVLNRVSHKHGGYYYYHYYSKKQKRTRQPAQRRWRWWPFFK